MSGRVASAVRRLSASVRHPWGGSRRPGEPPLVRGWLPILGCALDYGRDWPGFLAQQRERHGSTFTLHLLGRRMTVLLDSRDFALVIKNAQALRFAPIAEDISTRAFGYRSIFRTDITEEEQHELYVRYLRTGAMGPLAAATQEHLKRQLARQLARIPGDADGWRDVDLVDFVGRCIFLAGMTALFGEGPIDEPMHETFVRYDNRFAMLAAGIPLALLGSARRDREALVEHLRSAWPQASGFIAERRDLLLRYVDVEETARSQLSMMWASQANTIPAVQWALMLLLEHPSALAAVREEIDRVVTRDDEGRPEIDATSRRGTPQMDSAVLETLRLTSGSITIRRVVEPITLPLHDGRRYSLRVGDDVAVLPYLSHRDPEVFEDPLAFRHDRFVSERGAKQFYKAGERLGYALMPFGGGETMCPGRFLAQSEVKMFLALLLSDYDVELRPGYERPGFDFTRAGLGILPPRGACPARLRRRVAA